MMRLAFAAANRIVSHSPLSPSIKPSLVQSISPRTSKREVSVNLLDTPVSSMPGEQRRHRSMTSDEDTNDILRTLEASIGQLDAEPLVRGRMQL